MHRASPMPGRPVVEAWRPRRGGRLRRGPPTSSARRRPGRRGSAACRERERPASRAASPHGTRARISSVSRCSETARRTSALHDAAEVAVDGLGGWRNSEGCPVEAERRGIFCAMIPPLAHARHDHAAGAARSVATAAIEALVSLGMSSRIASASSSSTLSARSAVTCDLHPTAGRQTGHAGTGLARDRLSAPGGDEAPGMRPRPSARAAGCGASRAPVRASPCGHRRAGRRGGPGLLEERRPAPRRRLSVEAPARPKPRASCRARPRGRRRASTAEASDVQPHVRRSEHDLPGAAGSSQRGRDPPAIGRRVRAGPGDGAEPRRHGGRRGHEGRQPEDAAAEAASRGRRGEEGQARPDEELEREARGGRAEHDEEGGAKGPAPARTRSRIGGPRPSLSRRRSARSASSAPAPAQRQVGQATGPRPGVPGAENAANRARHEEPRVVRQGGPAGRERGGAGATTPGGRRSPPTASPSTAPSSAAS